MKITQSLILLAAAAATCEAFAPSSSCFRTTATATATTATQRFMTESSASSSDDVVASTSASMTAETVDDVDPYVAIGISQNELGIGVDAKDVLKWIGSKQELVDKFVRDNKGMSEDRADAEVMKFYMDAEMVNAYIKFEQDKVLNPPNYKEEAEQNLSDPKTIATYAAWLVGGASFGWVRKTIIEPKYASGEWEEIHIQLPTMPWMEQAASQAAAEKAAAVAAETVVAEPAAAAVSEAIEPAVSAAAEPAIAAVQAITTTAEIISAVLP